ncbi:unnamed protein product, partial [Cladocopium goreaui]
LNDLERANAELGALLPQLRQACQGLSVVREAQAQGVCTSELVPGHLPNEEVEARHGHRAGGKDVVPDDALHPLARPRQAPAAAKWDWVGTKGRVRAQGPCWRPSCPSPDSCNAGAGCPVHLRLQEQHGRDTEQYLRAMLAEGPFHPFSKHASLNEVSARFGRDVPADYPLPVAPGHVRKAKHTCRRPDCPFKGTDRACRGGRECEGRARLGSFQRVIGSPLVFCNAGMRIAL